MHELIALADIAILENPTTFVMPINYEGETYWIKRRPFSKLTFWHRLQKLISILIPFAILKPTVSLGGTSSLQHEAHSLQSLYEKGLPVPKCVYVGESYLITKHSGKSLPNVLHQLSTETEKQDLILKAFKTLYQFHAKDVCHGRPAIKDMTYLSGQVTLLDFEESPLEVMSLPEAKARDIWLFLISAAPFYKTNNADINQVLACYAKNDVLTYTCLKKWGLWLRPVDKLIRFLHLDACGKDIAKASIAMKLLSFKTP